VVSRGSKQPRPECPRIVERSDAAVYRQPDILLDVFSVRTDEPLQVPERALREPVDELSQSLLVAGLTPQDHEVEPQLAVPRTAFRRQPSSLAGP